MSASREKKARQERGVDYVSPKDEKARKENADIRRTTVIFSICAILFVLSVAALLVWNSGVIQRKSVAATVNGEKFTAGDVAFFYQNARANLFNSSLASNVDNSKSLRKQEHVGAAGTWYDYVIEQAMQSLTNAASVAQAAKAAGFDAGDKVDAQVNDAFSTINDAAANYGVSVSQYIKGVYGSLVTKDVLERNLRMTAYADAYIDSLSSADSYGDAELTAVYEADVNSFSTVRYETAIFLSSSYLSDDSATGETSETATGETSETATDASTESDDGSAALTLAKADAELAKNRIQDSGESVETVAGDYGATYSESTSYYSGSSELSEWLFDSARSEGDVTVLDYYGVGAQVVVFHGKARADFFPVNVRHILVEDEAKANELLAQFNAGDKTEDSFAALAEENSTDTGSASNGGLYENVYIGQMVKPFEDWCFDSSRQAGDVGIVKTDYGYHVMYFCGSSSTAYWKTLAASKLASDKVTEISSSAVSETLSGEKYIDR